MPGVRRIAAFLDSTRRKQKHVRQLQDAAQTRGIEVSVWRVAASEELILLAALQANPGASLAELARTLGWFYRNGEPNKSLVNRTLDTLKARGLVKKESGEWIVRRAGGSTKKRPFRA